jgi:hypothetical protein
MHLNAKPLKVALIAGIITLILIGFNALFDQDASQGQTTSSTQSDQAQSAGKDPFKEHLDKQQQGAVIQTHPPESSQSIQIKNGHTTTTVPVGTDPFKAFLDAQSKAKPEEAAISPFAK